MGESNATTASMTPFKEICFAGACNRGVCYLGCVKKLEELNLISFSGKDKIEKIAGVSIGAFIAACYIIGYSTEEMLKIIIEKDTKDFKDISLLEIEGAVLKGEEYRKWVHEVISQKVDPNITLLDLFNKSNIDFVMTATCIYAPGDEFTEGINYFSHKHTPNIPLIVAINASMSFPFIFPPIIYKDYQFIDGGVLDNFPLDQVSENAVGLRVNFMPIDGLHSTRSPISYIGKLFELISQRLKHLSPGTSNNIVMVKCDDFSIIDFEMSIDDKLTLYKRGYNAVQNHGFNNLKLTTT